MSVSFSIFLTLVLLLAVPEFLWAKKTPPPAPATQDLELVTADLKENIQDLRKNITNWRRIQWDSQLTAAEKKDWRLKAQTYLEECREYAAILAKVDEKKLPKSKASRQFLQERLTFQKELQNFQEVLQQP
jgi:hypothetical protein